MEHAPPDKEAISENYTRESSLLSAYQKLFLKETT